MSKFLAELVGVLLKLLAPWIKDKSTDEAKDSKPDESVKHRLKDRIRKYFPLILFFFLQGCAYKVIYVSDGTPVRLRETVKDVKVWAYDENKVLVSGVMDLPEGWYCLSDTPD